MTAIRLVDGIRAHVSTGELSLAKLVGRRLRFATNRPIYLDGHSNGRPLRCSPDLRFDHGRVAVFYDGCYWHECPTHRPNAHGGVVRERDERNNVALANLGWQVLRIWEHDDLRSAADLVVSTVRAARRPIASAAKRMPQLLPDAPDAPPSRCFVPRVLLDGRSMLLATCQRGMEHDRSAIGQDHTTAHNPAS